MTAPSLEPIGGGLFAEITYSPDDGAWYAIVVNDRGKEMHQTDFVVDFPAALRAARRWRAEENRRALKENQDAAGRCLVSAAERKPHPWAQYVPGAIVRLEDGREGTIVYHREGVVGIKWGRVEVDVDAIMAGPPMTWNDIDGGWPWYPEARLSAGGTIPGVEVLDVAFEVIS